MLVALSACSGSSDDGDKISIDDPTSASPTQSSTGTLLDLVPPKPERPADKKTKLGAIAMADHLFKVVYYAQGIAKTEPLTAIVDAKLCRGCKVPLDNIATETQNGVVVVGTQPITTSKAKVVNVDGEFATVSLTVNYPEKVVVDAKSGKAAGKRSPGSKILTTVNLRWVDNAWTVLDFASKDAKS
ncbi:MAG: hypothetical protein QOH68_1497 [Nocardioidaceae bacterium]|jgi:hypothetical protein|nr:hypothetical protein [Nocardioidaceae bacterium]